MHTLLAWRKAFREQACQSIVPEAVAETQIKQLGRDVRKLKQREYKLYREMLVGDLHLAWEQRSLAAERQCKKRYLTRPRSVVPSSSSASASACACMSNGSSDSTFARAG